VGFGYGFLRGGVEEKKGVTKKKLLHDENLKRTDPRRKRRTQEPPLTPEMEFGRLRLN